MWSSSFDGKSLEDRPEKYIAEYILNPQCRRLRNLCLTARDVMPYCASIITTYIIFNRKNICKEFLNTICKNTPTFQRTSCIKILTTKKKRKLKKNIILFLVIKPSTETRRRFCCFIIKPVTIHKRMDLLSRGVRRRRS